MNRNININIGISININIGISINTNKGISINISIFSFFCHEAGEKNVNEDVKDGDVNGCVND